MMSTLACCCYGGLHRASLQASLKLYLKCANQEMTNDTEHGTTVLWTCLWLWTLSSALYYSLPYVHAGKQTPSHLFIYFFHQASRTTAS